MPLQCEDIIRCFSHRTYFMHHVIHFCQISFLKNFRNLNSPLLPHKNPTPLFAIDSFKIKHNIVTLLTYRCGEQK